MRNYLLILAALPALYGNHSFYAGTSLSFNMMSGRRSDYVTNTDSQSASITRKKSVKNNGVFGGLFAGYLFRVNNFGISPEFFFNYGKIENKVSGTHSDTTAAVYTKFYITNRVTSQIGGNARVGYFLDCYFLYAFVGLHYQKAKYYVTAQQTPGDISLHDYAYSSSNQSASAVSFGLGAERPISDHFKIGLEMKYTKFPSKQYYYSLGDSEKTNITTKFKYRLLAFNFRISYVF